VNAQAAEVLDFPQAYDFATELRAFVLTSELLDSRELAVAFAETVPDTELRRVLADALKDRVAVVKHEIRSAATRPVVGSKWDQVCEAVASGKLDRWIISVGLPEAKLLLDCTLEDLRAVAEGHLAIAGSHERRANAYGRVAKLLKRAKAKTVRDLPESDVLEALNA
jgi:hypothetical protein